MFSLKNMKENNRELPIQRDETKKKKMICILVEHFLSQKNLELGRLHHLQEHREFHQRNQTANPQIPDFTELLKVSLIWIMTIKVNELLELLLQFLQQAILITLKQGEHIGVRIIKEGNFENKISPFRG